MRLTMKERKTLTKALAEQYRRASKKQKGQLLDQFVQSTGYNRCYAAWQLRHHGLRVEVSPGVVAQGDVRARPGRRCTPRYGPEVFKPLKKVWETLDYPCAKRLAAALPEVVPRLQACKELRVSKQVRAKLMTISPATIDRLLADERAKYNIKGRAHTKPGTFLKHQVPIRTFADWDEATAGFVEIDLVGHDGGVVRGEYCFSLDLTDVATGWSEQAAVPSKAQSYVFEALRALRARLPFALYGLDSDNGSEFINAQLVDYCRQEQITFTRSRPYRKNDTCYVEQKNWSIVRRYAGYGRLQSPEACQCLNRLYALLSDYVNFFLPSMKLKEKVRDGAKVTRRYDEPQTPYRRVLALPDVPASVKRALTRRYNGLNPAALHREIVRLQKQLNTLSARRPYGVEQVPPGPQPPHPGPNHPWRRSGRKGR